jgi:hypothetical protein
MSRKSISTAFTLMASSLLTYYGPANAAFEPRSLDADSFTVEAWYDTVAGKTWLKDLTANALAAGLYPGSTSTSTFTAASAWASGLVFGGTSDWRLPTLTEAQALQTAGLLTPAYFDGMGTGSGSGGFWREDYMWTSTPLTPGVSQYLLGISGSQVGVVNAAIYDRGFQVFAVANGSVGVPVTPIPEPSTYLLMVLGVCSLALVRRRSA